jgi:HAD superfamily hydrolase (TIGR01549 family)
MKESTIKALILDMDGTITQPVIDWKTLRSEIGATPGRSIMEHIRSLPDGAREKAESILLETERQATDHVELNEGFHELQTEIERRGLKTAVVTNNHGAALSNVLSQHNLSFDVALSRDDGDLKPSPDLILMALDRLDCSAENALGVGDSFLDITACSQAGVRCIYLTHNAPQFDHTPSVSGLLDVIPFLRA